MAELMEQFMADAASPAPVSNNQLEEIAELARMQVQIQIDIEAQEQVLAGMKENLRRITEVAIPNAMDSVGLSAFTLSDGSKLTVTENIYASVRKDKAEDAYRWLDKHGLGDIIKDDIKVSMGRGEYEFAQKVIGALTEIGAEYEEKLSVHAGTLSATIKEQRQKGVEFPEEFFSGVLPVKKTVIKPPKKAL